ncbi:MAG: hypothetical protein MJE66_01440, partial [Proteobacteria bacterium]|nr:hypothetical protein [Pseudomonadota bacterium]
RGQLASPQLLALGSRGAASLRSVASTVIGGTPAKRIQCNDRMRQREGETQATDIKVPSIWSKP